MQYSNRKIISHNNPSIFRAVGEKPFMELLVNPVSINPIYKKGEKKE